MTAKRTGNGGTFSGIGSQVDIKGLTRDRPWLLPSVSWHMRFPKTKAYERLLPKEPENTAFGGNFFAQPVTLSTVRPSTTVEDS